MARYRETEITAGSSYVRARAVICDNPLSGNGDPSVAFREQRVITDDAGVTSTHDLGDFRAAMTPSNLSTSFDLLDASGNATGATMTYQEVYGVMQSLYSHLAQQRDTTGL